MLQAELYLVVLEGCLQIPEFDCFQDQLRIHYQYQPVGLVLPLRLLGLVLYHLQTLLLATSAAKPPSEE